MSRKPKKGYFVRGQFVAEGSELQKLGESLLTLRGDLMQRLELSDKMLEAIADAKRITNFEGKRRQMQFIGKLMRGLDEATLQSVRDALEVQRTGSASDAL